MRFIPHTKEDIDEMLAVVGANDLEDLVAHVPAELRRRAALNLPPGLSEAEVAARLSALAERNRGAREYISFLGSGCYRHYVPAAVRAVVARAEFATSYTPYQPEASQGTTQAIFEFQTLIAQLSGLAVANAGMYDGASAAAEAVLMARRLLPKRHRVVLARSLWPDYRATVRTYLNAQPELEVVELPFNSESGTCDEVALRGLADEQLLCAVIGYPNGFGIIEPLERIARVVHEAGGLAISVTAEALAMGLLGAAGVLGADIAVGEVQSFGLAPQFGGPWAGFFATRQEFVRQMPGRLVGMTRDAQGRRAFCLTLATREQHIRRERATSNICTNHSLCALAAAVYLSLMGRQGLRELAARNVELAHEAAAMLAAHGMRPRFTGPFFNEFTLALPDVRGALSAAQARAVLAGVPLGPDYPDLADSIVIAVTELNSRDELGALCEALKQ
ncbi:MAG TPA: aminomethyl-transferring glycine dehydrogenase subunit GcvPA [Candidatus Binataceae bacterium]|nr:aminomethyl-transferring glycine dehydrogenase subunit GcvPA [Candidatus Binataceae bacterium]